jgi:polyisoprenoid-binding protein YceI
LMLSLATAVLLSACNNTSQSDTGQAAGTETQAATGAGETYNVVARQSAAKWHGTKIGGEHSGNIDIKAGELTVANNQVTGGTIVIDMTTISNTDLPDEDSKGKLVGHLKSDDFFSVEAYPNATFTIKGISPVANAAAGQPNYNVSGDMTIKDKTNPVSFPAYITTENGVAKAKADVTIDRSQFDVRYGSKSFFDNLGDKVISDEFTVSFDVVAQK